jgi:plastocyanin
VRVLRFSIMVGAVLAFAAACGGSGTTATVRPASTPGAPASVPAAGGCTGGVGTPVGIANNAFNPNATSVSVGGVVTWANADATTHTVTFDGGPDCGRLAQGASVSRTFDTAGSFTYHCTIHPFMTGTVTVQ